MANSNDSTGDYVLGTRDDEIHRLGLQHSVWRPRALDAWRRAGFTSGQTFLDVGSGPGYATMDLAEIAGADGNVVALDKSGRFLSHLTTRAAGLGIANIRTQQIDLDVDTLPGMQVDGAWCRWVLAFLHNPARLVGEIAKAVRPGGTFVSHEYFAYDTWRLLPPSVVLTEFVNAVTTGWRASGGEPDIGLQIPGWLVEAGFEIIETRPLVEVLTPRDYMWQWPKTFVAIGAERCVELGTLSRERADAVVAAFAQRERDPHTRMITPGVLEVIARKL